MTREELEVARLLARQKIQEGKGLLSKRSESDGPPDSSDQEPPKEDDLTAEVFCLQIPGDLRKLMQAWCVMCEASEAELVRLALRKFLGDCRPPGLGISDDNYLAR